MPSPGEWRAVRSGPLKLRAAALAGPELAAARLTLDGATVWEARSPSAGAAAPPWASVRLELAGKAASLPSLPMGRSYEILVRHPEDVRVAFVRRGMEPLEPSPAGPGTTRVGPITSTVPTLAGTTRWLIGLERQGESARVVETFQPPRHGGAIFREDGWEVLDPSNALDAEDGRRSPVLILPPTAWDGQVIREGSQTWALMEGEAWVGRTEPRPRIIPRLSGLGAR